MDVTDTVDGDTVDGDTVDGDTVDGVDVTVEARVAITIVQLLTYLGTRFYRSLSNIVR